jgi:hypothetical protein
VSLQKAHLIVLQNKTRQSTGCISAGVDIDPIGPDVGFSRGRMAVHDDFAEILLVQQKFFADPEQVALGLFPQRNARAHAGMDEKEIAAAE